jgi:hypothetical protein
MVLAAAEKQHPRLEQLLFLTRRCMSHCMLTAPPRC